MANLINPTLLMDLCPFLSTEYEITWNCRFSQHQVSTLLPSSLWWYVLHCLVSVYEMYRVTIQKTSYEMQLQ